MKVTTKTIHTVKFTEEELTELKKYAEVIKTINTTSICACVNCTGIDCSNCPLNAISDAEDHLPSFIQAYREAQINYPDLPSID